MKEIEIIVKLDGTSTVEAKGFNGIGCTDATKVFEEALGAVEKRKKKPEFFTQTVNQNKNILKRGW